mgnify:CR=1 FL=1
MNKKEIAKFTDAISDEKYMIAYQLLLDYIDQNRSKESIISLSKILSSKLRVKAQTAANTKAEKEALAYERILRLVVKINGESIYG